MTPSDKVPRVYDGVVEYNPKVSMQTGSDRQISHLIIETPAITLKDHDAIIKSLSQTEGFDSFDLFFRKDQHSGWVSCEPKFEWSSGYFKNQKMEVIDSKALTKANAENLVLREEVAHEKLNYKIVEKSLDEAEATVNALKLALEDAQREANEQKELNRKLAEKLASANALILFNANKASDGAVMNHANKLEDYRKEHTCNTTLPCKACDELTQQSQKGQGDGRS